MNGEKRFSVATLSMDERERHWLKGILEISETRDIKFYAFAPKPGATPDIVIVDIDKPKALDRWNAYQAANRNGKPITGIIVARQIPSPAPTYYLQRPVIASRMIAALERVATTEYQVVEAAAIELTEISPVTASGAKLQTGFRALVVDDSLPVRVQMKTALKPLAKHVDFAETGEEALELLKHHNYDIVFLDVILPGIDGYDICRVIKRDPSKQHTPVIMLTGNSSPADRVKGTLAGCDTYLIKPVRQAVFEEVVKEFIKTPTAA